MRKHDVRKWLHAVLDLLPVILIPVFMIYSHRHTIDSGSIQVPQNEVVDFNQLIPNDYIEFNHTYTETDFLPIPSSYINLTNIGHKVLCRFGSFSLVGEGDFYVYLSNGPEQGQRDSFIDTITGDYTRLNCIGNNCEVHVYFNLFDLTQMFGSGNEPTLQQFNEWYPNYYYEYTLSHKELLKNTSTITYNDTDIMSQFTYQLYNSVDKYFNMGNVFHLNEVYDWFNLNIFNGNAPIYIYIVYQIVLYELIMDLLMLLYSLFMWFIDMIQKLMDKPLNSVK